MVFVDVKHHAHLLWIISGASGMDENTDHHDNLTQAAESLCYFTAYIAEDRHKLPQDTSQALQHRVDPNSGQRERKTVEVLLYTSGCKLLLLVCFFVVFWGVGGLVLCHLLENRELKMVESWSTPLVVCFC